MMDVEFGRLILLRPENLNAAKSQASHDSEANVNIKIQVNAHALLLVISGAAVTQAD